MKIERNIDYILESIFVKNVKNVKNVKKEQEAVA